MNYKKPFSNRRVLTRVLLILTVLFANAQTHAAMYKYITKDGQTLLVGGFGEHLQ